jgi:hypothetical protein
MSEKALLFERWRPYPARGGGSAEGAESAAASTDLFSGFWGAPAVQAGAPIFGGSPLASAAPGTGGYHVVVQALAADGIPMPFPQPAVKGHGMDITAIEFYRKYTLLDQNNKPVPNVRLKESAVVLHNPQALVRNVETKEWTTDSTGSWADHPSLAPPEGMTFFPDSFEVIVDQKMWHQDSCIVHDTQRFVRLKGDNVNGVANHSSLTYHQAINVMVLH